MRIQRSASQTATGGIFLGHSLESSDVIPLQLKPMVFSFYARKGSNFSSVSSDISVQLATGTGTDGQPFAGLTNEVTQINSNSVLTTSWQRFSYTFTMPSNASELRFNINYTPVGTAGANDYWEITGIQLELGNIVTVVDHNGLQSDGSTEDIISTSQLSDKWRSFGWYVHEVDGHEISALRSVLAMRSYAKPTCVVARTIKGKGIDFMENNNEWHHNRLTQTMYERAVLSLSGNNECLS
jgi:hypothetical protein